MAFLVGVIMTRTLSVTPTRCVQRLGPAVACEASVGEGPA